jgi:hypothetical protein
MVKEMDRNEKAFKLGYWEIKISNKKACDFLAFIILIKIEILSPW